MEDLELVTSCYYFNILKQAITVLTILTYESLTNFLSYYLLLYNCYIIIIKIIIYTIKELDVQFTVLSI